MGDVTMATQIEIRDDIAVVTLTGKLMGGPETDECHLGIKTAISNGIRKAAIDLSGAEWINSRGMGMLMACYISFLNQDGELRLAGPTEKTKSLLRMTKLDTVFKSYETIEEAVESFRQP
jgi:anti-sigma B factor antagonist